MRSAKKKKVLVDARDAERAMTRVGRVLAKAVDALEDLREAVEALSVTSVGWNQNRIHVGARRGKGRS